MSKNTITLEGDFDADQATKEIAVYFDPADLANMIIDAIGNKVSKFQPGPGIKQKPKDVYEKDVAEARTEAAEGLINGCIQSGAIGEYKAIEIALSYLRNAEGKIDEAHKKAIMELLE